MKATVSKRTSSVTIGMDLGDKRHKYCVLNESGKVVKTGDIANSRGQLEAIARSYVGSRVVLECGTHSPWVSRYLEGLGMKVIVANARKTRAISENERKSDERDAELLARLGRVDPALLHPVIHGSEQAQHDMLQIKLRDALVRNRASLINAVRFTLKSLGYAVSNPSSASFHKTVGSEIPASCRVLIAPILAALEELSVRIKELETSIAQMARQRYPQAQKLQQIAGVGPITSIYFVLKIGEPARFARNRDVGAFLGLCPRRDQSGNTDKELRISKCGDRYLRRLLVNAAQYVLGPFGAPSALRDHGLRLTKEEGGTARAKKRAVVAVARKLAVLMLSLWKSQSSYQPFPEAIN
jgi:transposase